MKAHNALYLKSIALYLLEEGFVRAEVVVVGLAVLHISPPDVNHYAFDARIFQRLKSVRK